MKLFAQATKKDVIKIVADTSHIFNLVLKFLFEKNTALRERELLYISLFSRRAHAEMLRKMCGLLSFSVISNLWL